MTDVRFTLALIRAHSLDHLYVSAVTFAEIRFGIELVSDPGKRAELNGLARARGAAHVRVTSLACHRGTYVQVAALGRGRAQGGT
jgi:hypothetical protein